jgi:cation transporter-like permease
MYQTSKFKVVPHFLIFFSSFAVPDVTHLDPIVRLVFHERNEPSINSCIGSQGSQAMKRTSNIFLIPCATFLLVLSQQFPTIEGSIAAPRPSLSSIDILHKPSRIHKLTSIMSPSPSAPTSTSTSTSTSQSTEASALRELKEIIQSQRAEIDTLKSALQISKDAQTKSTRKPTSTAPSHSHGHGPPTDTQDPSLYLSAPFYKLALQRVGWLFLFLCSLSLTAVIMNGFEHTLSKQIELAYFVPLLAGHGGNTGGQTVGSVLSALSSGSVTTKDAVRIIRKEAMSGMLVGMLLGSFVGCMAYFVGGISSHVSVVVCCTLPLLSTIAATLASSIPFGCKLIGLDPAIIAAPAMTTFVDVTGLMSYFLIANRIFAWYGLEL